jgi:2-keto-3-deoxy-6-phosphogluconate aldolase
MATHESARVFEMLKTNRLIGLLAPTSAGQCLTAYETLFPLGIILEVAFRTEAAADGLRLVRERHPDALLLAGTVMTRAQARKALDAGAAGIVSADYIPGVVEECVKADVMAVPGGLGDCGKQLAQKADLYGCDFGELRVKHPYQWVYKLFPAATKTQTYIELASAWRGPYKDLTVIHTGGIALSNLARLAASDPAGIFCASALTAHADRPAEMAEEAAHWISTLKQARGA